MNSTSLKNNPFINRPQHKYGAVPFDDIQLDHFIPALDYAISEAENTLKSIKNNSDSPTFDNTILLMEKATELLETVDYTYFNLHILICICVQPQQSYDPS